MESEFHRGKVKFFNGKMGFIEWNENNDDVHIGKDSFQGKPPKEGDYVKFKVISQSKGPHAKKLSIIEDERIKFFKNNVLNLSEVSYDEFCDNAKSYAVKLRDNKVTTSQIRKVYSRVMNANNIRDIKELRPQFAYLAGRNKNNNTMNEFMDLLDYLAKNAQKEVDLENIKTFFESIVAYRKYVGDDK